MEWRSFRATATQWRIASAIVIVAVAAGTWVLYTFPPVTAGFYPQCAFRLVTGLDCPGCGSTRAMHALLHGRFGEAFLFNPFLFAVMLVVGLALPGTLRGEPPRFLYTRWFGWGSFVVVMTWWIGRNVYL